MALFQQAIKMTKEQANKETLVNSALAEFGTYTNLVQNATDNTPEFAASKLPKKVKDAILKVLETNKKQKRYLVAYVATIYTYNTLSGVSELKDLMKSIKNLGVDIKYVGAPKYRLLSEGEDYNEAEEKIKKVEELVKEKLKKGVFEIEKEKLRKENEDILSTIGA